MVLTRVRNLRIANTTKTIIFLLEAGLWPGSSSTSDYTLFRHAQEMRVISISTDHAGGERQLPIEPPGSGAIAGTSGIGATQPLAHQT